jgi:hypothetical protein
MAHVRAVWHTTDVALGILSPGYMPKRESPRDLRSMMAWAEGGPFARLALRRAGSPRARVQRPP